MAATPAAASANGRAVFAAGRRPVTARRLAPRLVRRASWRAVAGGGIAPIIEEISESRLQFWPATFGAEAPPLDLSAIDYVAGVPQLTIESTKSDEQPDVSGRMMFGCGEVVIGFVRDVTWEAWINRYLPGAERKIDGEFVYYELPEMPFLGKARMLVARIECADGGRQLGRRSVEGGRRRAAGSVVERRCVALGRARGRPRGNRGHRREHRPQYAHA